MRTRIKTLVGVILLAVSILPPFNAYATQSNCKDFTVIFARGSGQPQSTKSQEDKDRKKEFVEFSERIESSVPNNISFENKELVYDAVGGYPAMFNAEFSWNNTGLYRDSVSQGVENLTRQLNNEHQKCPNQRYVLAGYSQGAHVIGNTLFNLNDEVANRIISVQLFGDPKFKHNSYAATGSFIRRTGGILEPRKEDFPQRYKGKIQSWCKDGDGICENSAAIEIARASKHNTYWENEIPIAVNYTIELLKQHFSGFQNKNIQMGSLGEKADIVFAVDTTATMQGVLNNVKANINAFIAQTMALSKDTRVGIVAYNDTQNGCAVKQPQKLLNLTNSLADFTSQFSGLSGACGGSAGDDTYSGLEMAINSQPWRADARRFVILLGGNTPNIPDKYSSSATQASVIQSAINNNVMASGVVRGDLAVQISMHKSLLENTGGKAIFMKAGATSEFMKMYESILTLYSGLQSLPLSRISHGEFGRPGIPFVLSAGSSFDPDGAIISYEWDVNYDGVADATTTEPVYLHTFTNDYSGKVGLRVVDGSNNFSYASSDISIKESNVLPEVPNAPPNVQATRSDDDSITLSWGNTISFWQRLWLTSPVNAQGQSSVESYIIKRNDGEVIGVVDGSIQSVKINDVPDGQDISFSVSGVNREGSSQEAISNILGSGTQTLGVTTIFTRQIVETIDTIINRMSEQVKNTFGSVLGQKVAQQSNSAQTESGQVQAAETKTLQSGLSPATKTSFFFLLVGFIVVGVILLRTTSWYRHKKR